MAKGGASENETCRELSSWLTSGKDRAVFRRTQMSGGKATVRSRRGKKTKYEYGDITFSDPAGKPIIDFFLLENKSGYKDVISILDFIDAPNKHPQLVKWWEKAEQEKEAAGRHFSLVVFRRNHKSKCVFMTTELFCLIEDWCGEYSKNTIDLYTEKGEWVIIRFDDFLSWLTPATIIQILKERGWKDEPDDTRRDTADDKGADKPYLRRSKVR